MDLLWVDAALSTSQATIAQGNWKDKGHGAPDTGSPTSVLKLHQGKNTPLGYVFSFLDVFV